MKNANTKKIRRFNTGELFIVEKLDINENVYLAKKSIHGNPVGQYVKFSVSEKGINWDFNS